MNQHQLRSLLEQVADGSVTTDDAMLQLKSAPFQDLGFAKPDHHRALRQGVAEVIYGASKTAEQMIGIVTSFKRGEKRIEVDDLAYRIYCRVWVAIYPLRKVTRRAKNWLRKVLRGLMRRLLK